MGGAKKGVTKMNILCNVRHSSIKGYYRLARWLFPRMCECQYRKCVLLPRILLSQGILVRSK